MRRRAALLAAAALLGLALSADARVASRAAAPGTVDELISTCPPAAEIAAIGADFKVVLDVDPTAGALVCTAAAGSADLTRLQERTYQALRVLRAVRFARPLPWTTDGLYDWLAGAIDGIRFRADITEGFCCEPAGVIDLPVADLAALGTTRWIDPRTGRGLDELVDAIVHEARHNETGRHSCGADDGTLLELGAWGVQYYLRLWQTAYTGPFFDSPDPYGPYFREVALGRSEALRPRICFLPTVDLSLELADSPDPVPSGSTLRYTAAVRNGGPGRSFETYLYAEIPKGTVLISFSSSQGHCLAPARGPLGCSFDPLEAGDAATVTLVLRVAAPSGATVSNRAVPGAIGARVTGAVRDSNPANNSAGAETRVAPPLPPCPGRIGRGGRVLIGTAGNDRLTGTSGADVLCGLGGDDVLDGKGGADILRGGGGDDLLLARDGVRDTVDGGPGRDRARVDPKLDRVRLVEQLL